MVLGNRIESFSGTLGVSSSSSSSSGSPYRAYDSSASEPEEKPDRDDFDEAFEGVRIAGGRRSFPRLSTGDIFEELEEMEPFLCLSAE